MLLTITNTAQPATDLGYLLGPVRVMDNLSLRPREYIISLKGLEVARYELAQGCDTVMFCLSKGLAVQLDRIGVATKCNFCLPRVDAGLQKGLNPGVDPDASPVCTGSCIANALHFGDFDDPNSSVSRMVRENSVARMSEELGTDPFLYYIVE